MASGCSIHNHFPSTMVSGIVPPGPWLFSQHPPQWDISWSALLRKCSFKCNFYELLIGCLFSPRLPSSPLLSYSAIPNLPIWNDFHRCLFQGQGNVRTMYRKLMYPHVKSSQKWVHAGAGSGLGAWSQGGVSTGLWGLGPRLSGWLEQDGAEAMKLPLAT